MDSVGWVREQAANNGQSTDNVWSELNIERKNPWVAGHLV